MVTINFMDADDVSVPGVKEGIEAIIKLLLDQSDCGYYSNLSSLFDYIDPLILVSMEDYYSMSTEEYQKILQKNVEHRLQIINELLPVKFEKDETLLNALKMIRKEFPNWPNKETLH